MASYDVTRSIVIALVVLVIVVSLLSCIRRRRAIAFQQQMAPQAHVTELGGVAVGGYGNTNRNTLYAYQYPPPAGSPQPNVSPYAPPQTSSYYTPPATPPQSHVAYPPMQQYPQQNAGSQYVAAQDGSAGLSAPSAPTAPTAPMAPGALDSDGVPTVAPPPYTPTK